MKNEYYFQNQFGVYNVVNNFVNEGINDGVKKELVKVTKLIINKPSNPSPLNNAINQNTSLTLSWYSSDPDEDPLTYDIYLGTNNPPTNKVSTSQTAKSYNATNLSNSTTYFWKIIAKDDHSHSTAGSIWKFKATGTAPQPPTLSSPANNATNISTSPTLSWNTSSGAASYGLQVSTSSSFTSFVYNQNGLSDTSKQVSGLSNSSTYYWRVSSINSYGTSAWSSPWSFVTTGTIPSAPVVLSPSDGAQNQSTSPTLTWSTSNGAASYTLQVSTNSSFSSFVYNQNGLTSTTKQISGLSNATLYYWRVSATNSYGTSGWSTPTWSFTTIGTAPQAPTLLSPANGTTNQSTSPTLSWNTSSGATTYTLQVSTNNSFSSFVYNQNGFTSATKQINGLSNSTLYYWRVNAANSYGTSAYSSPWSFVTTGTIPSAPVVLSPSDGAQNQSTSPTLTWSTSNGAASYTLQVSTNSSFSSFVYNQNGLSDTSKQVNGLSNSATYYWRVNAANSYGTSAYSSPWSFVTTGTIPSAPVLTSPSNSATNQSTSPTLTWNASNGAASYTLQVSTSNSFANYVYNQSGLTNLSQQITGLSNSTTYYWRVSATNSYGTSAWSSPWLFVTTGTAPSAPVLLSPSDGAQNQSTSPTLIWKTNNGAASYTLQVSTSNSFSSFVYNQNGLSDTSKQVSGLSNSTTYYWRVSATNSYGTSAWSSPWSFVTIGTAPNAPVLLSPGNGAVNQSTSPTLTWSTSSGAASYTLQVSTNNSFSSFVYNQNGLSDTSKQVNGLSNSATYYWRVNATNSYGTSAWSSPWSFVTTGTAPSAPVLLSPSNGVTNQSITPTLNWNTSSGAASYTLQVSTNNSFSSFVYNQNGLTNTTKQISGLGNATLYYWRVNAANSYGTSGWSTPTWSFTTIGTAPQAPTLSSPNNGVINQPTSPTLIWNTSGGATSYTLQVSTSNSFISFVYNQNGLSDTTKQVSGLSNSAAYYWRVSATNSYGTSGWSTPTWSFTTVGIAPPTPTLLLPSNGATNQFTSPTLTWNVSSGAASYTLQVSTNNSFSNFVYNQGGLTSTTKQISGLSNDTPYYWRVNATNSYGTSGWSTPNWSFITESGGGTPCPGTVTYAGKTYNTVQIGNQCWLNENLNVGTMITSNSASDHQINNGIIEKYCYDNNASNCDTYGGLYQWDEAMQYSTTPSAQGVCPNGWHIPTNTEFQTLIDAVGGSGNALKTLGTGTGSGTGTNTSGFSALPAGYRGYFNGNFFTLDNATFFWSSIELGNLRDSYSLGLGYTIDNDVTINAEWGTNGFSVRCLKD